MGVITMTLLSPIDGAVVVQGDDVTFAARVDAVDPAAGPLHARWYSSLPAYPRPPAAPCSPADPGNPPNLDLVALNPVGTSSWSFTRALCLGSQAVTVAAKDQPGDDAAALAAVRHAGVAGGAPPGSPAPCVVHVLAATSLVPAPPLGLPPPRVSLTRAGGLWAAAPAGWDTVTYQALNQLDYSWSFVPVAGGASIHLASPQFQDRDGTHPPRLGFPTIPGSVPAGDYATRLLVAFRPRPAQAASTTIDVRIVD